MVRRLELQTKLETVPGVKKAYFQPPANVQMEFPCIVYREDSTEARFAGNSPYRLTKRYEVTVIDRDPDTEIPDVVRRFEMCSHDTTFSANNLNHYVFTLYF